MDVWTSKWRERNKTDGTILKIIKMFIRFVNAFGLSKLVQINLMTLGLDKGDRRDVLDSLIFRSPLCGILFFGNLSLRRVWKIHRFPPYGCFRVHKDVSRVISRATTNRLTTTITTYVLRLNSPVNSRLFTVMWHDVTAIYHRTDANISCEFTSPDARSEFRL